MKTTPTKPNSELPAWLDWIAAGLAILTASAGLLRVSLVRPWSEALNEEALKYFAVAGGLLLLRKVQSISFGDTKVELQGLKQEFATLKEDVYELNEETKTANSVAQHFSVPSTAETLAAVTNSSALFVTNQVEDAAKGSNRWNRNPGGAENDPWKGVFGGKAENNHRRLRANVAESKNNPGWYRVHLWVESTSADKHPLTNRVRFFLHDEFANNRPFVSVRKGLAQLRLHAYGAFTVGALADDGKTELEFDLSQNESFPKEFREAD